MIPLHKLAKLPRSQRLRKITKVFTGAEIRLSAGGDLQEAELRSLSAILELLLADQEFSAAGQNDLQDALSRFGADALPPASGADGGVIWGLNTVRHLLLAETGRSPADWDFIDHQGKLNAARRRIFPGMQVYFEDIRSPFNVGAMFRSAESFGVEQIFLSPLCADPLHPRAFRTAMGCVDIIPWERTPLPGEAVAGRTSERHVPEGPFFALETGGTPLERFKFPQKGVMIVGSEELGTSPEALTLADSSLGRVSIPTYGAKGSINVSTAFGIVLQTWAAKIVNPS
ncbi:MAG: TrmH family RNA methyltransferase [Treponema sp.]|jgi:TrmH family RNA methyltransferase|nr:TrmH family RNA methyltransferase [Treponema sp.]